jgi:5'-nucleotidase
MTFILTNDDGIDADGIHALSNAIKGEKIIVAPKKCLSGCGHQITTRSSIHVQKRNENEYAIDGTPADCSRIGITQICPDVKWVLSGINAGANLGIDTYISGTVAAVREATILGIPSIAISHWINKPLVIDWAMATELSKKVLADLLPRELPPNCFWNVNLPHLSPNSKNPEIIFCKSSIDPLPIKYKIEGDLYFYQGEYSQRKRTINTDVDVCFNGNISVSMIQL